MKPEKLIIKKVFFIAKSFLTTMLTYKKCILKTKQKLHNENEEEVMVKNTSFRISCNEYF